MHSSFCMCISHNCNTSPHSAIYDTYICQNLRCFTGNSMFKAKIILEFYVNKGRKLPKSTEEQNQRGIITTVK